MIDPGEEGGEIADPPGGEDPRQFCVYPDSGSLEYNYKIGSLVFEADVGVVPETRIVSVICISVVDDKLLVAVPFSCWHRLVRERRLPANSLTKAVSLAVAASSADKRTEVIEDTFVKLWIGFLAPPFESCITFEEPPEVPIPFLTEDHEDCYIPSPEALVTIADERFSFLSLESGEEDQPKASSPPEDPNRRIAALEEAVLGMKQNFQVLMDRLEKPPAEKPPAATKPKVAEAKSSAAGSGIPGLDPQVVKSALQSGIDRSQLEQLGHMMKRFGGKDLGDVPVSKKKLDPLGEEIELGAAQAPQVVEEVPSDPIAHALVKLTNIVDALAVNKQKKPRTLAELLDEPTFAGESSSSSSQLTSSRRHSAVLKALRKALTESPAEVFSCIESRMLQDFGAPEAGPGQPDSGGTFRGWAEHRSHVPAIPGTVRMLWAICGALDCLRKDKIDEGKARLALLVAAIDQVGVDRGSWVLAAEGLLEESPPISSFTRHQPPDLSESQHTKLWDVAWAESFMHKIKEIDDFVEKRQKLGKRFQKPPNSENQDLKGKGKKGRGKGSSSQPQEEANSGNWKRKMFHPQRVIYTLGTFVTMASMRADPRPPSLSLQFQRRYLEVELHLFIPKVGGLLVFVWLLSSEDLFQNSFVLFIDAWLLHLNRWVPLTFGLCPCRFWRRWGNSFRPTLQIMLLWDEVSTWLS